MANESALTIATNIFTSPSEAFVAIKEHRKVAFPLLALLVAFSAISFVYTNAVDLAWLIETQITANNPEMTEEQREQAVEASLALSPTVYGAIGAVSTCIFIVLWTFVLALYYTGVSFFSHDGVKLKQWFALLLWCSLPLLLGTIAQIVHVLSVDARFMAQDEINPLSFGNLLSIDRSGATTVQRILLGIDVTALWALVLTVLGYQAFTGSSFVKAVAVVLGPLVAIVAVSSAIAFA